MTQADEIRKALQTVMQTYWNLVPLKLENVPFKQPSLPWASFYIKYGKSTQASIGDNRRCRVRGLAVLQIFVAKNVGTGKAVQIADAFATLLQYRQIQLGLTDITLETMGLNDAEDKPDYSQKNAIIPFDADTMESGTAKSLIIRPPIGS